jgi:hypothetical protein
VPQLTQRKDGRSDNDEAEETPYLHPSMAQEIRSNALSMGSFHACGHIQGFTTDVGFDRRCRRLIAGISFMLVVVLTKSSVR